MISLGTLAPGDAATLLARLAARPGIRATDAAIAEITRLCGTSLGRRSAPASGSGKGTRRFSLPPRGFARRWAGSISGSAIWGPVRAANLR